MIKALTFDVDGTLYSLKRVKIKAFFTMPSSIRFLRLFSRVREQLRRERFSGDIKKEQVERISAIMGIDWEITYRMVEELIYRRLFSLPKKMYRGLYEVLELLKEKGLKAGIISDYPSERKLKALGLDGYDWSVIVNGEDYGQLKPSTKLFIAASEIMKVPPEYILHIGDREDCDVEGAIESNFRSALLGSSRIDSKADIVLNSYGELKRLILDDFSVLYH